MKIMQTKKTKLVLSIASLGFVFLAGCAPVNNLPTLGNLTPVANVALTSAQAKTDAKILGTLVVLNQDEESISALAERKASNPIVKNYAMWLFREHRQNLQETQNVSQRLGIVPEQGRTAIVLQRKGRDMFASLNRLNGPAFDASYVHDMVKGHVAALHLIDQKLIPEASSPLLKKHLENTRRHVADRLQRAKAIQQQMQMAH